MTRKISGSTALRVFAAAGWVALAFGLWRGGWGYLWQVACVAAVLFVAVFVYEYLWGAERGERPDDR